jgi:hypothetical protein
MRDNIAWDGGIPTVGSSPFPSEPEQYVVAFVNYLLTRTPV